MAGRHKHSPGSKVLEFRGLGHKTGNNTGLVSPRSGKKEPLVDKFDWQLFSEFKTCIIANIGISIQDKIAEDPSNVRYAVELLEDVDCNVREHVALVLKISAKNKVDISIAIPALANALKDWDESVAKYAAEALGTAAEKGINVSIAIPALVDALKSENARNIFSAMDLREAATKALRNAVDNGNYETVKSVVAVLTVFMQSKEFMLEMQNNTPLYVEMIGCISEILITAHASEKTWVGAQS